MLDDLRKLMPDAKTSTLDGDPCARAAVPGAEVVVTADGKTLYAELDTGPLVYEGDSVEVCAEAITVLRELRS